MEYVIPAILGWLVLLFAAYSVVRVSSWAVFRSLLDYEEKKRGIQEAPSRSA